MFRTIIRNGLLSLVICSSLTWGYAAENEFIEDNNISAASLKTLEKALGDYDKRVVSQISKETCVKNMQTIGYKEPSVNQWHTYIMLLASGCDLPTNDQFIYMHMFMTNHQNASRTEFDIFLEVLRKNLNCERLEQDWADVLYIKANCANVDCLNIDNIDNLQFLRKLGIEYPKDRDFDALRNIRSKGQIPNYALISQYSDDTENLEIHPKD